MNKKWIAAGVAGVVIAAAVHSGSAVAREGQQIWQGGEKMAAIRQGIADVNLSESQKSKIRVILTNAAPTIEPVLHQMERNHKALEAATDSTNYDATSVRLIADRQGRLAADLVVDGAQIKRQVYAVLTPDQRAKVDADEDQVNQILASHHFGELLTVFLQ